MYEIYCKLRDERGLKDADVVRETKITKSTFSDWKSGRSKPKNDKLQKIADYFGVTLDYLMTGKESSTSTQNTDLTSKDERDIAKDMENLIKKLKDNENGPASFDGEPIPDGDIDLLAGQIELMLKRLKPINKEKYRPDKNKK